MTMYVKVRAYAVNRDTPGEAQDVWDDAGPELSDGVELVGDGEFIKTSDSFPSTPNGYDPLWIEAINGVLAERETSVRITDLDDDLWERFIGPLVDALEDGYEVGR